MFTMATTAQPQKFVGALKTEQNGGARWKFVYIF